MYNIVPKAEIVPASSEGIKYRDSPKSPNHRKIILVLTNCTNNTPKTASTFSSIKMFAGLRSK
jgi:hypothetical protein